MTVLLYLAGSLDEIGLQALDGAHFDAEVVEDGVHEGQLRRRGPAGVVDDALQLQQVRPAAERGEGIGQGLDRLFELVDVVRRIIAFLLVGAIEPLRSGGRTAHVRLGYKSVHSR